MPEPTQSEQCPVCVTEVIPDSDGNCPFCHTEVVPVAKNPNELLQFYCVVCEDFFVSRRDRSGYDQAPCPKCGDLSNTPEFHVGELARQRKDKYAVMFWMLKIVGIIFVSGLGWVILRSLMQ